MKTLLKSFHQPYTWLSSTLRLPKSNWSWTRSHTY
ncbi:hypothetical protein AOLI_G00330950 [Acnodon oligacanthus]